MGILSNLEQRSSLSNPALWMYPAFGAVDTGTGIAVTENTALGSTAIWAGVRIISESIASIPLGVFERRDDDGRDIRRDHLLHRILHNSPNPMLTALEFREMQMMNLLLSGNSYAEIVRNGAGRVAELWPLWPHRVKVQAHDGKVLYRVSVPNGKEVFLKPDQVLHVRGASRGGLVGLDPIATNAQSVGLSLSLQKFQSKFFANSARPGGVLEHPGAMSEDAQKRFKKAWEDSHRGLDQAHRVAILEEGMTWKQMGISPEQAQTIEARKFQLGETARLLNMPPHLLRDLERATFSNIEQQSIEFVSYTIRPWAVRLEQRYDMQTLTAKEQERFFTKHILEGLLRGDMKSRFEAYAIARNGGWMSANDIRRIEDQNPIPDGDVYIVQGAMIPIADAGSGQDTNSARMVQRGERRTVQEREVIRDSYTEIFRDVADRIVKKEVNAITRAVKKFLGQRTEAEFRAWMDEFYDGHAEEVADAFSRSLLSLAGIMQGQAVADVGGEIGLTDSIRDFSQEYADSLGRKWDASSVGQLKEILRDVSPEDLEAALLARLDEWTETRADKVGRREANQATNALIGPAYLGLGTTKWVSRTVGDTCPYCKALNGKVVKIGETILPAGDFQPEGADTPLLVRRNLTHPPYHDGCDCLVVAQ